MLLEVVFSPHVWCLSHCESCQPIVSCIWTKFIKETLSYFKFLRPDSIHPVGLYLVVELVRLSDFAMWQCCEFELFFNRWNFPLLSLIQQNSLNRLEIVVFQVFTANRRYLFSLFRGTYSKLRELLFHLFVLDWTHISGTSC